jgi:hypothetical protein
MTTEFMKKYANYNFTHSVIKTGNYTLTTTDEHVKLTSSATLTLPALSTLTSSGKAKKVYYMEISGAAVTGTLSSNSADTINGSGTTFASATNGAFIVIKANVADNNWEVENVAPLLATANYLDDSVTTEKIAGDAIDGTLIADDSIDSEHYVDGSIDTAHIADAQITGAKTSLTKQYGHVVKVTSSTDPQTFASIPVAVTITNVTTVSEDTTAANIVVKNGTDTVCTIAKGVLASGGAGAFTLANTSLGAAGTLTVESSATNGDAYVKVDFEATA